MALRVPGMTSKSFLETTEKNFSINGYPFDAAGIEMLNIYSLFSISIYFLSATTQ